MPWELWRQDDNGNEFLIETYESKQEAEAAQHELESRKHKQMYWVTERKDKEDN